MDKALKQRLVGASVLVALAVVILPMLLGGQPESPQEARQIEIPPRPQELSFETRRFPIGEQEPDRPSAVPERPAPSLDENAPPTRAGDDSPEGESRTLQERLEEVAAEADEVKEADAATEAREPQSEVSATEPALVDTGGSVAEQPRAPSEPAAEAPESASSGESESIGGRYLVQVASFSSTANANRLAGSLRDSGMPVLMDTVDSSAGVLHRVRVGPFDQRAQAEQVVARLGRQVPDLSPRLVDLRPDDEAPVTEPDDPLIRWVVQVGVFSEQTNAEQLVYELRDAGFPASSRAETSGGATVYRVRVGPEVKRAAAVQLRDRILAERGIEGIVQSTE